MKRVISFILATVMLLYLCACGSKGKDTLTEDMLIGKTFTTGERSKYEGEPFSSITFEKGIMVNKYLSIEYPGTWFIEDNRVLISCSHTNDSTSFKYIDGYLIAENSLIEGELPDGKTFDCTITHTKGRVTYGKETGIVTSLSQITYTFKTDGTFERIIDSLEDGEQFQIEGEYTRNGNLLTLYMRTSEIEQVIGYLYSEGNNRIYDNVLLPE